MISGVIDRAIKIGEAISLYQANHGQHHIEGQKNLWILKPGNHGLNCADSNTGYFQVR